MAEDKKKLAKIKEEGPNRFQQFKSDLDNNLGQRVEKGDMNPATATAISTLTDFFVPDDYVDAAATMVPGGKLLTKGSKAVKGIKTIRKKGKQIDKAVEAKKVENAKLPAHQQKTAEELKKEAKRDMLEETAPEAIDYSDRVAGPKVIEKTKDKVWDNLKKQKPES